MSKKMLITIMLLSNCFSASAEFYTKTLDSDEGDKLYSPSQARSISLQEEVVFFPSNTYVSNQDIAENVDPQNKLPNRITTKQFSNTTRPDNKEIIRQKSDQFRNREMYLRYADSEISADSIIVTISGLNKQQSKDIRRLLLREIGFIRDMELVERDEGIGIYLMRLKKIDIKQLSEILDGYPVGGFQLSLIAYDKKGIDLTLR